MTLKTLPYLLAIASFSITGCELIVEETTGTVEPAPEGEPEPEPEPEPEVGSASVRFINVADGSDAQDITVSCPAGDDVSSGELYFSQGTGYLEAPAGECTVSSSGASSSASLAEDGSYSVAVLPSVGGGLELIVREDDRSAPAADHARINFIHARPFAGTLVSQVYYNWGSLDEEWFDEGGDRGTYFIDQGEADGYEYPYAAEPIWMFNQWGVPAAEASSALEIDAFIQAGSNAVVDVYVTCTGACAPEDAFVLGHYADGSTATTAGCQIWEDNVGFVDCDAN